LGYAGGLSFNLLAKLTGKKFSVSAVRVKKFCATTQFDATTVHNSGLKHHLLYQKAFTVLCPSAAEQALRIYRYQNGWGSF